MDSRTRNRRTVTLLLLFIAGGPLLTLAVAWACAAWMPAFVLREDRQPAWNYQRPALWKRPVQSIADDPREGVGVNASMTSWIVFARPGDARLYPGQEESILAPSEHPDWRLVVFHMPGVAAGWPLRALYCQGGPAAFQGLGSEDQGPIVTDQMARDNGLWVPSLGERMSGPAYLRLAGLIGNRRPMPVTPIWRGMLIDSLFWGGVLVFAVEVPRLVRRERRRRRNACLACGYSLAGLTSCPECGSGRQERG